jgi:hypothetical protein
MTWVAFSLASAMCAAFGATVGLDATTAHNVAPVFVVVFLALWAFVVYQAEHRRES